MKKLILATILAGFSTIGTEIQADSLQIPLFSKHFYNPSYELNEFNPGLFYKKEMNNHFSLIGGGYRNSFDKTSIVFGGEVQYKYFGVQAGFATGYDELYGNSLQPIGTVFGELPITERFSIRGSVIPHPKNGSASMSLIINLD